MASIQSVLLGFATGILVGERVTPKRGRRGKPGRTGRVGQHGRPGPIGPMGATGPAGPGFQMPRVFGNTAGVTGNFMPPEDDDAARSLNFHAVPEQQE